MGSESTEETKRITIEDSSEGDSFMVRGVGLQHGVDAEQPEDSGEVSTPPMGESTPMNGKVLRREERPQYVAKKKLWVEPDRITEEIIDSSSEGDSVTSRHSTMSKRYVEKRMGEPVIGRGRLMPNRNDLGDLEHEMRG